ncbi:aminoglycoside phosphotransferase [Paenarthrobacter ureafaciens]|uniref:phosphotransferase n=1 Tax=Paenarthrobacter ureafaciens TaxID=37931 RepID=UPI0015BFAAB4|nr:phosphotransferase [Paenarthrobacter ureafaciens]NWL28033.1 aminoglycoside phosphotransferase [Paenarthrobacter ureafaciens]
MNTNPEAHTTLLTATTELTPQAAKDLLRNEYGLSCESIKRLAGERDDNFKVVTTSGTFFLKVAHSAEESAVTAFQTDVLLHLENHAPDLPIPRIIQTLEGKPEFTITDSGAPRRGRLTTFMPGESFDGLPTTANLRRNIGESLAKLSLALVGFSHPTADHLELLWDISRTSSLRAIVATLHDPDMRNSLMEGIDDFDSRVLPRLQPLRQRIVHGDFTANNLMRDPDGDHISAIIDFGDTTRSQMINDLAVAAAYELKPTGDLLGPALDIIVGYNAVQPLVQEEIDILFDLIVTRTVLRLAITEWRAERFPENKDYVLRNNPRTWQVLDRLRSISREQAQQEILNACKAA